MIAFDATSRASGTGTSCTFSHTCNGSNRLLIVATFHQTNENIQSVTYGGVAMSFLGRALQEGGARRIELWGLVAPASGANNVVVTRTNGTNTLAARAISFTGAKQSGLPDAVNANVTGSGTTVTGTLSTIASGAWILSWYRNDNANYTTVGIATDRGGVVADGGIPANPKMATYGPKTPQGVVSIQYTKEASANDVGLMVSIAPSVDSMPTNTAFLLAMV